MKMLTPAIMALALTACATVPDPIMVNVPTPVMPEAPEILTVLPVLPTPRFVHPGTDDAMVCLDRDGVERLKDIVSELAARESAWRHWYEEGRAKSVVIEDVPARGMPPVGETPQEAGSED